MTALASVPPTPVVQAARFLDFQAKTLIPGMADVDVAIRLDTLGNGDGTADATTLALKGTAMGQPIDETRTATVDAAERGLMVGVRQAFEGAEYLKRAGHVEDRVLPPVENGMLRMTFTDDLGAGRFYDFNMENAEPADEPFGVALETYLKAVFPDASM